MNNLTYGIELECYPENYTSFRKEVSNKKSFLIKSDESLSVGGIEVIFNGGCSYNQMTVRLDNLMNIIKTHRVIHGVSGGKFYTGKSRNISNLNNSSLHVHIGVPNRFFLCDILRLAINTSNSHKNLQKLGWRKSPLWASNCKNDIDGTLHTLWRWNYLFDAGIYFERYRGLNLCNIGKKYKNTVEFRYAHSSLIEHPRHFYKYIDEITKIYTDSFTGEKEFSYKGWKIIETGSGSGLTKNIELHRQDTNSTKVLSIVFRD